MRKNTKFSRLIKYSKTLIEKKEKKLEKNRF